MWSGRCVAGRSPRPSCHWLARSAVLCLHSTLSAQYFVCTALCLYFVLRTSYALRLSFVRATSILLQGFLSAARSAKLRLALRRLRRSAIDAWQVRLLLALKGRSMQRRSLPSLAPRRGRAAVPARPGGAPQAPEPSTVQYCRVSSLALTPVLQLHALFAALRPAVGYRIYRSVTTGQQPCAYVLRPYRIMLSWQWPPQPRSARSGA